MQIVARSRVHPGVAARASRDGKPSFFRSLRKSEKSSEIIKGFDKDLLAGFRQSAVLLDRKGAIDWVSGARTQSMAKQTRITIETDSLLVLRARKRLRAWCPACGSEEEMIPLNEIGIVSNLPLPEVKAWMESEDLHYIHAADGGPLICLNSMLKRMRKPKVEERPDGEQS